MHRRTVLLIGDRYAVPGIEEISDSRLAAFSARLRADALADDTCLRVDAERCVLAISRDGQCGRGDRLDCRGRKELGLAGGRRAAREYEDRSGEEGERDAHQAIHGGSFDEETRSTHYQISAITADSSSAP